MPNWPQRGANQKFGSDNDVWSQKLNFFMQNSDPDSAKHKGRQFFFFKLDLKWRFCIKKVSFWLQTSLSEPNFWLAPLWGGLGMVVQLRLTGVKSAYFYPPNSRFRYWFEVLWLGCLKILVLSMPESLEAIQSKKSKNDTLIFFTEFWFHRPSN